MATFKQGFTLAELLWVLLIIAIVAVIMFPVFMKAREGGGPSCHSNEMLIGLALLQYAQDNDSRMPPGLPPSGMGWAGRLYPYAKSNRVFNCPDDATQAKPPQAVVSYGFNRNLAGKAARAGIRLDALERPAKTVALFEVAGDTADIGSPEEGAAGGATMFSPVGDGTSLPLRCQPLGQFCDAKYATGYLGGRTPMYPPGPFTGKEARHSSSTGMSGSNFLFADGHVKWLAPDKVSGGANALTSSAAQTGTLMGRAAGTANGAYYGTFSVR